MPRASSGCLFYYDVLIFSCLCDGMHALHVGVRGQFSRSTLENLGQTSAISFDGKCFNPLLQVLEIKLWWSCLATSATKPSYWPGCVLFLLSHSPQRMGPGHKYVTVYA